VRRVPMLMLMNAQVDAPLAWRKVWGGMLRAAAVTPPTGWLAGAALYPLERRLVRDREESPTTELLVCRLRGETCSTRRARGGGVAGGDVRTRETVGHSGDAR